MNDRNPELPERDERLARLRDDVPADPGFRNRLRESFLSGAIEAGKDGDRASTLRIRRGPWWAATAVAAALIAAVLFQVLSPAEPWLVLEDVSGPGAITVNGQSVSLAEASALESLMVPGATVEVPDGAALTLVLGEAVIWEVAGGSRMVLPEREGSADGSSATLRLLVGELRIQTGRRFAGSRLTVHTPEALVHVTGSLLSVQCNESGTCVCVLDGQVQVGKDEADLEPIPPGQRKVIPREGDGKIVPVAPPHQAGVEDFQQRVSERLPDR